jgi:hypothetical protein
MPLGEKIVGVMMKKEESNQARGQENIRGAEVKSR